MEKDEFAAKLKSMRLFADVSANDGPGLIVVRTEGMPVNGISAYNSADSLLREKGHYLVKPFNRIVKALAKALKYFGKLDEFYASSQREVRSHIDDREDYKLSKDGVYIRTLRNNNITGSGKRNHGHAERSTHTFMKNCKATLNLFTLLSGEKLVIQITGSAKDATAWTKFADVDNSEKEYDNPVWTKDVASENKAAVDAVEKMIGIQAQVDEGKLSVEDGREQFKEAYVEWVIAHLATHPNFVERRVIGLNCEDPMGSYKADYSKEQ